MRTCLPKIRTRSPSQQSPSDRHTAAVYKTHASTRSSTPHTASAGLLPTFVTRSHVSGASRRRQAPACVAHLIVARLERVLASNGGALPQARRTCKVRRTDHQHRCQLKLSSRVDDLPMHRGGARARRESGRNGGPHGEKKFLADFMDNGKDAEGTLAR